MEALGSHIWSHMTWVVENVPNNKITVSEFHLHQLCLRSMFDAWLYDDVFQLILLDMKALQMAVLLLSAGWQLLFTRQRCRKEQVISDGLEVMTGVSQAERDGSN